MPYADRVREFLEELAARSGGKIHLQRRSIRSPSPTMRTAPPSSACNRCTARRRRCALFRIGRHQLDRRPLRDPELSGRSRGIPGIRRGQAHPGVGHAEKAGDRTDELAAACRGSSIPMTGQMGEPWPILTQLQQLFTLRTLTRGRRPHRQGRRCADAGASEAAAAEDPVRHRSIRHARRQDTAVRRSRMPAPTSAVRIRRIRSPARWPITPRTSQPLLAAWGVDYDPTKVIGDLERGLEVRTSMQCAADPPHRHSRPAPRRHESEGCRHGVARSRSTSRPSDALAAAPGRQDHLRAAAAEFRRVPSRCPRSASTR